MDPFLYVEEEFANVKRALDDTLRHDYGPGQTKGYYDECLFRLTHIEPRLKRLASEPDPIAKRAGISSVLDELADLANRLALIERSRLGEFSWPFADVVRQIATGVLADEVDLFDTVIAPIIHVIAEGTGYQIRNEQVLGPSKRRRLVTVAFPRQLKHHVLMHAIFGHEIGHAAFFSTGSKPICRGIVAPLLRRKGPLQVPATVMDWLRQKNAPDELKGRFPEDADPITPANLDHWVLELICDLFGLLIFGPAFVAAHRALLEPAARSPFHVDLQPSTHPPYAVRRRMLAQGMRLLGWDKPQTKAGDEPYYQSEMSFLNYACEDDFDEWCTVFDDEQLNEALAQLKNVFSKDPSLLATPPSRSDLLQLIKRLEAGLPPLLETIDEHGVATYAPNSADHCLYAGWSYWFGRTAIHKEGALSFFNLNRLCDLGLLQQQAIDRMASYKAAHQ